MMNKIKCIIEIEYEGLYDEDLLADNLTDFFENDEQTCCDKGKIKVLSIYSSAYRSFGNEIFPQK